MSDLPDQAKRGYDVTSDGQRFVMARPFEARPQELERIENFMELVKAAFAN